MSRLSDSAESLSTFPKRELLDFFIRLGLIILAVVACERIFAPFIPIMLWALTLAVALYPLLKIVMSRTGMSQSRSATLLVVSAIALIGTPTVMLGSSFAEHIFSVVEQLEGSELTVEAPPAEVRDWPLIGERVFALWTSAHEDLAGVIEQLRPQLESFVKLALHGAASTAGTLLFFLGAVIIAGIMMAYGESGSRAMVRIFQRMAGEQQGSALHTLSTLTVRSVAVGVVGVAFIQALLLGVGFLFAGIPAAGLLALVVMVVGILQLPALLVSLPAIAYLWLAGDGGSGANTVATVYLLVAGTADNFLKPMLLGRGVDVPMPVVLLGALGGMVSTGIIGLFVGAVVLSVGYELFMGWVNEGIPEEILQDSPEDG
ncbi:MAG: AI-2E family transporter [Pseudomonadota bacterium]